MTEARQLGAVLGVAVMGAVFAAAGESDLTAGREAIAAGFAAAMATGAAVIAFAAAFGYARMPRRQPE